jgi:hypothetical protein
MAGVLATPTVGDSRFDRLGEITLKLESGLNAVFSPVSVAGRIPTAQPQPQEHPRSNFLSIHCRLARRTEVKGREKPQGERVGQHATDDHGGQRALDFTPDATLTAME